MNDETASPYAAVTRSRACSLAEPTEVIYQNGALTMAPFVSRSSPARYSRTISTAQARTSASLENVIHGSFTRRMAARPDGEGT